MSWRHVYRVVSRSPKFSVAVITCWTLGIVSAALTYALADAYFFRPPAHVRAPERVVRLYGTVDESDPPPVKTTTFAYSYVQALSASLPHTTIAAYDLTDQSGFVNERAGDLHVAATTAGYFDVLGVTPAVGRLFGRQTEDESAGVPIVISHRLWTTQYQASLAALGQRIRIRDRQFTIVGVAPPDFTGAEVGGIDAWVRLEDAGDVLQGTDWRTANTWWLSIVARLPTATSLQTFESAASAVLTRDLNARHTTPVNRTHIVAASLNPGSAPVLSAVGRTVVLVTAAGEALLLLASINVGGLFLLRGLARQREVAIRRALGATTARVIAETCGEVFALGIVTVALANLGILLIGRPVASLVAPNAELFSSAFGGRSVLFTSLATIIAVVIAGGIAAGGVLATPIIGAIGSTRATNSRRQHMLRSLVVGGQTAATTALIAGAILIGASLVALRSLNLGLDISKVVVISTPRQYVADHPQEAQSFLRRIESQLKPLPNVQATSLGISAPFISGVGVAINSLEHPAVWQNKAGVPFLNAVGIDYFQTVGVRPDRGRIFTAADTAGKERVALINETFAQVGWPHRDPIGQCVILGADVKNPCYNVIGIVPDARRFKLVPEQPAMQVYIPLSQNLFADSYPVTTLLVRGRWSSAAMLAPISHIVHVDTPARADISVRSLEDVVDPQIRPWRSASWVWGLFALAAMLLTTVGVYGALAYTAEQRKRDMAIRLVLGAPVSRVVVQMARAMVLACLIGVTIGGLSMVIARKHIAALLDATSGHNALLITAGGLFVAAVVLVASTVPFIRYARRPLASSLGAD